jgi:hypothetical protein
MFIGVKVEGAGMDAFQYNDLQEGIDHAHEIYEHGKNFDYETDSFIIFATQEGTREMKAVFSYEHDFMGPPGEE